MAIYFDSNGQKLSEWCWKGRDKYHRHCHFCDAHVRCDNAGKPQLPQHTTKKNYKKAVKQGQENKQTNIFFTDLLLYLL